MNSTLVDANANDRLLKTLHQNACVQPMLIVFNLIHVFMYLLQYSSSFVDKQQAQAFFEAVHIAFLLIFSLELLINICANGWTFFQDNWNKFDFIIIVCEVCFWVASTDSSCISSLRLVRLLRLFLWFGRFEALNKVLRIMRRSAAAVAWLLVILFVIIVFFAILGVHHFREDHAGFEHVWEAAWSLFKVAQGGSWSDEDVPEWYQVPFNTFSLFVMAMILAVFQENYARHKKPVNDKPQQGKRESIVDADEELLDEKAESETVISEGHVDKFVVPQTDRERTTMVALEVISFRYPSGAPNSSGEPCPPNVAKGESCACATPNVAGGEHINAEAEAKVEQQNI